MAFMAERTGHRGQAVPSGFIGQRETSNLTSSRHVRFKRSKLLKIFEFGSNTLSYLSFVFQIRDLIEKPQEVLKKENEFKETINKMMEDLKSMQSLKVELQTLNHKVTTTNSRVLQNIDEVVTSNHKMLRIVIAELRSTIKLVHTVRIEMNQNFRKLLDASRYSRIEPTLSKVYNIIIGFETHQDEINQLGLTDHVEKLEDRGGILDFLKDSTSPTGDSLNTFLYDIIRHNYAIPDNADDKVAFRALDALYYGTISYVAIMMFLIEQYSFLTDFYYTNIDFDKYNHFFSVIQRTFKDFRHSLVGGEKGSLISDVTNILNTVKKKFQEDDILKHLNKMSNSLDSVKEEILNINLRLIEDMPSKLKGLPFDFNMEMIRTPLGKWVERARVRYAVQFRKEGRYSRVGPWSDPLEVRDGACPTVRIPVDGGRRTRLVFRRVGEHRPELVAVLESDVETSFRDIHRDLYNAAGTCGETALGEMETLLANGADPDRRFEGGRQAIHAAAMAGNVGAAERLVRLNAAYLEAADDDGFTPMHIAAEIGANKFVQFLVNLNADVNLRTKSKLLTPLYLAALHGYEDVVQTLLAKKLTDVNAKEKEGFTPFHAAVVGGKRVIEVFMADNRTNVNAISNEYLTPLHLACIGGYLDVAHQLFNNNNISINARASGNLTALHFAAMDESVEMVKFLISKNEIDHNPKSINNWTPLHFAITVKKSLVPSELIKNNKTDINVAGELNILPIHVAAIYGRKDVIVELIERGTDVNKPTQDGVTALHFAVRYKHLDVVACLCEYNANIDARNFESKTPFDYAKDAAAFNILTYLQIKSDIANDPDYKDGPHRAAQNGYLDVLKILAKDEESFRSINDSGESILHSSIESENTEIVDYLLDKNLNVNFTNEKGESPLFYAAKKGPIYMYEHLIARGAGFYPEDKTPVHAAAEGGKRNMVTFFVEKKHFDPNSKTFEGETPLHFAAQSGNLDVVQYLVESKVSDIKAKTVRHKTPLDFAVTAGGNIEVIKYLINRGAEFSDKEANYINTFLYAAENGDMGLVQYLAENKGVNQTYMFAEFPLHRAAKSGNLKLFEYLMEKEYGDVKSKTPRNETTLHFAAQSGKLELVQYLDLTVRIQINLETTDNKMPLHYAAERGHINVVKYFVSRGTDFNDKSSNYRKTLLHASALGYLNLVEYLVDEKGALPQSKKIHSTQPLHVASKNGHLAIVKYLLRKKGVEIDPVNDKGEIPLFLAAQSGHLKVVQYLIVKGSDFNYKSKEEKTVQHYACESGKVELVKYLEHKGASLSFRNIYNETPIFYAALGGHFELVKFMHENKHQTISDKITGNLTLLHYASQGGNLSLLTYLEDKGLKLEFTPSTISPLFFGVNSGKIEVVKYLVKKGADINEKGWNYSETLKSHYNEEFKGFFLLTPLHLAAKRGNLDIVLYFVKNGVDVNSRNTMKLTPLHYASKEGKLDVVKDLLEKNADIKATDIIGKSSLHFAAENGALDVVKYLVTKGADINIKDQEEDTPLHYSASNGKLEVVKYLIEMEVDPDSKNKAYITPLHEAAGKGELEVVKYLLKVGADVNAINNLRSTPLHEAAAYENDRLDVVECLVDHGANFIFQDNKNRTALHQAAKEGNGKIVNYLVFKGSDINIKDVQEFTPLFDSVDGGYLSITKFLVAYGAEINIADKSGETPLQHAAKFERKDIYEYLLTMGADQTIKSNESQITGNEVKSFALKSIKSTNARRKRSGDNVSRINESIVKANNTLSYFEQSEPFKRFGRYFLQDNSDRSHENTLRRVQTSVDGTNTLLLIHNLLRTKILQRRSSSRKLSESEVMGQSLTVNVLLEAAIKEATTKTNISFRTQNINFVNTLKEINKKIIEGKYDDIMLLLKSAVTEGFKESNLSTHEKSKFMDEFSRRLEYKLHQHLQKYIKRRS